uniref:Helicase C-terminal domain-containing protein n=1 Tax=Chlamydomonas leiostraca TaxID=1034604 RepID=A0A6T8U2J1_9CHLO|mmetsp:Transcript_33311/g.84408  ORF Transcript_33311/g.84408 Transcript_33311/m.84408 type:complete len:249 (+) Transcript_33311:234-980(+)|eukprot:CAMPEP_0202861792 /NCGR_PEP_ID=MMETSP1391-20130828/3067_1 /ASSEMBLY_ACC=CAM_ASM_000867 /TAXON_ID=1034604 /ORGANISM="Chlamydomonas leiostraca, Strain SAG 11-49" /LENGTH=248 /DNA_ID=CAMNT_0049541229 /DNA_START=167 /DNA_END=913 /DNA_ORIENTATION=+
MASTPTPAPSAAKPQPSAVRPFYVAVGSAGAKLGTLLELLTALQLQAGRKLTTVICCSGRDSLDEVVCGLLEDASFTVAVLHADMTDKEREFQVSHFKRLVAAQADAADGAGGSGGGMAASTASAQGAAAGGAASSQSAAPADTSIAADESSLVLAATDVCLKTLPRELLPLGASLLIQYDMPHKKEVLARRMSSVFGGGRDRRGAAPITIHFVVAGEAAQFRAVEKYTAPAMIAEMPVHVADVFTQR